MSSASSAPVAIVTGGSRGIGQACVQALAQAGYCVVLSYAGQAQKAQQVQQQLQQQGHQVVAMQANVACSTSADAMVKMALDTFGRLDVLVNNAGVTRDGLIMRMKDEDWETVLNVNLGAYMRLSRAAMRGMMKRRHGRIIGITSVVGVTGNAGQTNYAASKAGMIGFSKALAQEVASRGITVNVIAPGMIKTPMTDVLTDERARYARSRTAAF